MSKNEIRLDAPWLKSAPLKAVFAAIEAGGFEARVVGGAVRNALLGRPISDIDIATPALPEDVIRLASAAGLGTHPTGLSHGTVTVVSNGTPFEVTTLRRDVETDGRHAVVAFTDDWAEDAKRRDFTINALSAAPDGTLFDYTGGRGDLTAGRVRFIGEARDRIREDYLRILRFFRFSAEYGRGAPDPGGLAACTELESGMTQLSAERIGAEMMKLIVSARAAEICSAMERTGILKTILGTQTHSERLARLQDIETRLGVPADAAGRLAALTLDGPEKADDAARRLRLSNAMAAALKAAATSHPALNPNTSEHDAMGLLYRLGGDAFGRAVRHAWAASGAAASDPAWRGRSLLAARWSPPAMPVSGADVLALGLAPGPNVGSVLAAFEVWWIEHNFPSDPALQKRKLSELAGKA